MEIAIIVLSLLCAYFGWELIRKSYRLGVLEQERKQNIVPDIKHLSENNERLLRDIERILEDDKYVIDLHKERIKQRRDTYKIFQTFKR